ncbi:class I SAM-dependent methyltransferase [Pseudooceanicola sp. LIPI14-2-Ac024]|uniref:class I SAM-dependent methyltransferase n=1 Tax=Pseudooceanicola sp. LIPI14-2-Ac024 TaxID=3344875 RepID=UPI0035D0F0CB
MRAIARRKFQVLIDGLVQRGTLVVDLPDGARLRAGDGSGPPVHVRIDSWSTVVRLVLNPETGVGEAFTAGHLVMIEGRVYDLLDLVFRNLGAEEVKGLSRVSRGALRMALKVNGYNSPARSKANVAHHYDLDGRLYALFLDSDRQYSCAYFETPGATLEEAQLAKKRHLAAKMDLRPGQRVLDIGSGWGGLALYLARVAGVSVHGVTLSEEQLAVSRDRAQAAGLTDRVQFDLQDYRALDRRFDRIVSVGMFEHVGRQSYGEFFETAAKLLADDGVMMLHYIGRATEPFETNGWILRNIFPGGYMPSLSEVLPVIEKAGLIVTDVEVLRLHYAETLRAWRERFLSRRDEAVALYDERFARMWEFYLSAAETGFRYQGLVIHQIQLARSQTAVPLTRDYIAAAEAELRHREADRGLAEPKLAAE